MKLIKIKLKNFRNHKNLEIIFQDGITAIIGANGKGKSSIIEAIQFLFTGELNAKSKDDVISLGETSGYVSGEFELNNKKGHIERHLDVTKVILKYDGKEYLKASQVKEQWESLLQINPEIFNKVIIAKQGEIPLLFTGDSSVRSSIFQKIFLVPNTNKLKDIIWSDYIKQLPPLFPVEDKEKLEKEINFKLEQIEDKKLQLEQISDLDFSSLSNCQSVVIEITNALENEKKTKGLAQENEKLKTLIEEKKKELKEFPISKENIKIVLEDFSKKKTELSSLKVTLNSYSVFNNSENCPTCGQAISDITLLIDTLKKSCDELRYDQEDHDIYLSLNKKYDEINESIQNLNREIEINQREIKNLSSDDYKNIDLDASLIDAKAALKELENQLSLKHTLEMAISNLNIEIESFKKRIKDSAVNAEKNKKRNEFEQILLQLYDVFHVNRFPRKVIEKYSSIVSEYLSDNLIKFNMPYNAVVGEDFNIVISNNEGILPSVSGGQKMIVGLCLRLALLQLFAQNFSFFIVDEATQSLDVANQELYFELVKGLKNSQWKQIILVDHSERLADAVDHIFDLGRD